MWGLRGQRAAPGPRRPAARGRAAGRGARPRAAARVRLALGVLTFMSFVPLPARVMILSSSLMCDECEISFYIYNKTLQSSILYPT